MTAARLSGQVVLISGAASGIGAAIAARCIAEGAKVICADLRGEAARALADGLGAAALGIACDVAGSRLGGGGRGERSAAFRPA